MEIKGKKIVAIGGAGFIGSHIVEQLLQEEVDQVVVLDNLYRGDWNNLIESKGDSRLELVEGDILDVDRL